MSYLGVPIPFTDTHKIFYLLRRLIDGRDFTREEKALIGAWLPKTPYLEVEVTPGGFLKRPTIEIYYTDKGQQAYVCAANAVHYAYQELHQAWEEVYLGTAKGEKDAWHKANLRQQEVLPGVLTKYRIHSKAELIAYRVIVEPGDIMSFTKEDFFTIIKVKKFNSEDCWAEGFTYEECLQSLNEPVSILQERYSKITLDTIKERYKG